MTHLKNINFTFKSSGNSIPRPYVNVKFKNEDREDSIACIVDSGADFSTLPMQFGAYMLGINFTGKIAPAEIKLEWQKLDQSDNKKLSKFIEKITEKKFSVPIDIGYACGKGASGFLYPIEVEINSFKQIVPIFWINADVIPLIGRVGIFDQAKEVVFNAKENKGYFKF